MMIAMYMQANPYVSQVSVWFGALIVAMAAASALIGWGFTAKAKRLLKAVALAVFVAVLVGSAQSTLFAFYMECAGWWCCDSWWCF